MSETATLLALLQRHYIKPGLDLPGGIFLPEVGWNGGGPGAGSGGCDAIYVGQPRPSSSRSMSGIRTYSTSPRATVASCSAPARMCMTRTEGCR